MRAYLKVFLFIITFVACTNAQILKNNLHNLNNLSIELTGQKEFISEKIQQKILTEIKLKLMSAGMKVVPSDDASARMIINLNAIKSTFSEHRILVQMSVLENVTVDRLKQQKIPAITYSNSSFFTGKEIEQSVYDKIMDVMIINFIEDYLSQK